MNRTDKDIWLETRYPLTVVTDRYGGTYSDAAYLAFPLDFDEVPEDVNGDDTECVHFWRCYDEPVGKGATVQEAIDDLVEQVKESEDERIRKDLIGFIEDIINHGIKEAVAKHNYGDGKQWLAYLEKKKEQKPAEWSDEDEKMLEEIINHIYTTSIQRIPARPGSDIGKSWIKFLKSLRPQPKWKPTDEQIEVLSQAVETFAGYNDYPAIKSLYEDLQKLKEE